MKKFVFDFRMLLYTLALFCINILTIPESYLLIDFFRFKLNKGNITSCILTAVFVFLFSAVYVVIIKKVVSFQNDILTFCIILLLVDPLFRCTFLSLKHLILLIASTALNFYLVEGKSFKFKTVPFAAFVFFSTMLDVESVFIYIPLNILVYGFVWSAEKIKLAKPTRIRTGKQQIKGKNAVLKTEICNVIVPAALFILAILLNPKISNIVFTLDKVAYHYTHADTFLHSVRFGLGILPSAFIFIVFIKKYLSVISEGEKITLNCILEKASFLVGVALSYILILVGIFVFKNTASITLFNLISISAIILTYRFNPESSQKVFDDFSAILLKKKFFLCAVFAVWFYLSQLLFKYVQQHYLLEQIIILAGDRL